MSLIFVTGGARSGKSRFALEMAMQSQLPVTFLATAQAFDLEMAVRIEQHQLERQALVWQTREEPFNIHQALLETSGLVILECLSLWVSNLLLAEVTQAQMQQRLTDVLELQATRASPLIVVSNEVGSGVVPEYPLGRTYRDWLGRANQMVAAASSQAHLLVAGLPIRLK